MTSIRITSPSAASALVLADLMADHGATATPVGDRWEVVVPLTDASREGVAFCLATAREWLDRCGLESTTVTLDGETHLLRGSGNGPSGPLQ